MTKPSSPAVLSLCSETGLKIYAERSLGSTGKNRLLASVWAVAAAGSLTAINNRVWPVAVFLTAMPLALTAAFSVNNKDARAYEMLRFQGNYFEIARFDRLGRLSEHLILPAYHTRFIIQGDEEEFKIHAAIKGKTYPIGAFLSIPEKEELFAILKEAHKFQTLPDHLRMIAVTEAPPEPHA